MVFYDLHIQSFVYNCTCELKNLRKNYRGNDFEIQGWNQEIGGGEEVNGYLGKYSGNDKIRYNTRTSLI